MYDIVIVGFGFSSIPLIRELERSDVNFAVISSENDSVWDRLNKYNRLNFDLVSSCLTSFFSFDLCEQYQGDYYPTAKQFYAMLCKWRNHYGHKVLNDKVLKVENSTDFSYIYTSNGAIIKARHLVFATGFSRSILSSLIDLNYEAQNQTFVFDTFGDSVNLLISHLIPHGAKIIIRSNGFNPRDKTVPTLNISHTLDQLEFHNARYLSHENYKELFYGALPGSGSSNLLGDHFPNTIRYQVDSDSKSHPRSGSIAVKYWSIDEYERRFGNDLLKAFDDGYFLNDISMWMHIGKVVVLPKSTPLNLHNKTLTISGKKIHFDHYVKGDVELPRLPPILIDGNIEYRYKVRECFMGVIPKDLRNVYLLGYIRPYSGGLANIVEMQALFIHKLVTSVDFSCRIKNNLCKRIEAYNKHYYANSLPNAYDHVVHYGFYTEDLARLINIDIKLPKFPTLKDLIFYYSFPNNAFKYRIKGDYAVKGLSALVTKVNREYFSFIVPFAYLMRFSLVDPQIRQDWFHSAERIFFNDMRHKRRYVPFLEKYISAYRQAYGLHVDDVRDPAWDFLQIATQNANITNLPLKTGSCKSGLFDHDMEQEIQLLVSWFKHGLTSVGIDELPLDPNRAVFFSELVNPKEYELPYLY